MSRRTRYKAAIAQRAARHDASPPTPRQARKAAFRRRQHQAYILVEGRWVLRLAAPFTGGR